MQKQKQAVEFYHDLKIDQYTTYSHGFEIGFRVCDVPVVDMMMIGFIVVVGSDCQGILSGIKFVWCLFAC